MEMEKSAEYWISHIHALNRYRQYVQSALDLIDRDLEACKKRLNDKVNSSE